ncbi:hypothetical protein KY366_08085 [Candidatus Woesearchaeota archaeon]|nr:hypothetical protein [Candidatus Woesearchaeota archaeon]
MGLLSWADEKAKRLDVWDIGCIKWSSVLFGIIIGAYISDLAKRYIWILAAMVVLLAIRPLYSFFRK